MKRNNGEAQTPQSLSFNHNLIHNTAMTAMEQSDSTSMDGSRTTESPRQTNDNNFAGDGNEGTNIDNETSVASNNNNSNANDSSGEVVLQEMKVFLKTMQRERDHTLTRCLESTMMMDILSMMGADDVDLDHHENSDMVMV